VQGEKGNFHRKEVAAKGEEKRKWGKTGGGRGCPPPSKKTGQKLADISKGPTAGTHAPGKGEGEETLFWRGEGPSECTYWEEPVGEGRGRTELGGG